MCNFLKDETLKWLHVITTKVNLVDASISHVICHIHIHVTYLNLHIYSDLLHVILNKNSDFSRVLYLYAIEKVKKEIINNKKRDFMQNHTFYAKKRYFLQKVRNAVQSQSTWKNVD